MHLQAIAESEAVAIGAIVDPSAQARTQAETVDSRPRGCASLDEALDAAAVALRRRCIRSLVSDLCRSWATDPLREAVRQLAEEIDDAAAAARAAGVLLQIGYWRRFVPELVALRAMLLRDGRFGELLQVTCSQWDGEPPAMSFRRRVGGIAIDMGVHELDQIRWLTGRDVRDPACVAARADRG